MQVLISLLILLYVGALSRSLLPNSFGSNNNENSMNKSRRIQSEKDRFLGNKNRKNEQREDEGHIIFDYMPLMTMNSRGDWTSSSSTSQLDFFSHSSGFATFVAHRKSLSSADIFIEIWLYDGKYTDNKAAKISFTYNNNTDFNTANSTYKNNNIGMQIIEFDEFSEEATKICQGSYQLNFVDDATNMPYTKTDGSLEDLVVHIQVESSNCNLEISAKVGISDSTYETNVMDYSIVMTLICLFHLYASIQMIRTVTQTESVSHGYSLVTLALLTSWDIFLCFFNLYEALNVEINYFHYFISPAFWYFILASIFETRLLTLVWRTRYHRQFENMNDVRRGFATFYLRLYGLLSITILSSYFFLPYIWFSSFTALFFVPQILHNLVRGQKPKFDWLYMFFFGFIRVILPLYARGCPISIFKLTPNRLFVISYTGIVATQILIMYLQSKLGARFFIPSCLLPPKYSYYSKINLDALAKDESCSICMDSLNQEPTCSKTPILKSLNHATSQIMQTPCKHIFHEKCLKDWMEIKFECPYCRSNLPYLE